MHVESYSSTEEMLEALKQRRAHALAGLAPAQAALTYDDHWVQFHDLDRGHLIWGRVWRLEEVALAELNSGADWDETRNVVAETEEALANGFVYGKAYDKFDPDGEKGSTHKAHIWPIEKRLFDAAREVGFDYLNLKDPAMRLLLEVAFVSMRAHVRGRSA